MTTARDYAEQHRPGRHARGQARAAAARPRARDALPALRLAAPGRPANLAIVPGQARRRAAGRGHARPEPARAHPPRAREPRAPGDRAVRVGAARVSPTRRSRSAAASSRSSPTSSATSRSTPSASPRTASRSATTRSPATSGTSSITSTTPLEFVCAMGLTFENANLDFASDYAAAARACGDAETARRRSIRSTPTRFAHVHFAWAWLQPARAATPTRGRRYLAHVRPPLGPRRARGPRFDRDARRRAGFAEASSTRSRRSAADAARAGELAVRLLGEPRLRGAVGAARRCRRPRRGSGSAPLLRAARRARARRARVEIWAPAPRRCPRGSLDRDRPLRDDARRHARARRPRVGRPGRRRPRTIAGSPLAVQRALGALAPGARGVDHRALDEPAARRAPWVAKAPWTAAGRDRIHGNGPRRRRAARRGSPAARAVRRARRRAVARALARRSACARIIEHRAASRPRRRTRCSPTRAAAFLGIDLAEPPLAPRRARAARRARRRRRRRARALGYSGPFTVDAFVHTPGGLPRAVRDQRAPLVRPRRPRARRPARSASAPPPAGAHVLVAPTADDRLTAWRA